ncbi:IS66-like element accessory protein TnpA [Acidiphilium sp. MT5]
MQEELNEVFDGAPIASTPTSARRSAPIERVEVITRGARRRWSMVEKQAIVSESLEPGVVRAEICRRHDISSGQLSTWRQQCCVGMRDNAGAVVPTFARAMVMPMVRGSERMADAEERTTAPTLERRSRDRARSGAQIEIALPNGAIIRVGTAVDQMALARVLAALRDQ